MCFTDTFQHFSISFLLKSEYFLDLKKIFFYIFLEFSKKNCLKNIS
jgi:hypothetical protein